jgi:hypothetical protein
MGDSTPTPASEPADDFFSSWDKPAIKKPTPPISRTGTPPVVGRTPSPFLNAGANGKEISRSASPLTKSDSTSEAKPATSRITTSAALRKTTAAGPRKANILGAKKTTSKLGAKKVTGDLIDFDEAEKRAKEEAERIEKLGYDLEAETAATKAAAASSKKEASNVALPTPASTSSYGSSQTREKSAAEVERLGMGFGRLGFGQVGGNRPAAAAATKKNAGGFGSVGPVKATTEGTSCMKLFSMVILTSLQRMKNAMRETSLAPRRASLPMSSLERVHLTPMPRLRQRRGCRVSKGLPPFHPTHTLVDPKRKRAPKTMVTSSQQPRISYASSGSRLAMILTI